MVTFDALTAGRFQSRPNRFIALVELCGCLERCHVKNTGRLRELLVPGATVYCSRSDDPARKTAWTLLLVEHEGQLVSIDSQAPNEAAFCYVRDGGLGARPEGLRRETVHGDSRFDLSFLLADRPCFLEVKGVTLLEDGAARFPDAPTERGVKHLHGLTRAVSEGFGAYVLFVIQRQPVLRFEPNDRRDPLFGAALREAAAAGVRVLAASCEVTTAHMVITDRVPVEL